MEDSTIQYVLSFITKKCKYTKSTKGERNDEKLFSIISEPPCFREKQKL